MPKSNAYVFDLDGTLVDTGQHTIDSFAFALGPFGVKVDAALIEQTRARNTATLFNGLVSEEKIPQVRERIRIYWKKHAEQVLLYTGVQEVLQEIAGRGFRMNVWTGRDRHSAHAILKAKGIDRLFHQIVTCDDVPVNKPSPDGLVKIAKSLKIDIKALTHVGDHDHDIEGAQAVGACAVAVSWGNLGAGKTWKAKPDYKFHSTAEFLAWICTRHSQKVPTKHKVKVG